MGKLSQMVKHPDEVWPLLVMALAAQRAKQLPSDKSRAFCYDMLNRVSRRCPQHPGCQSRCCIACMPARSAAAAHACNLSGRY